MNQVVAENIELSGFSRNYLILVHANGWILHFYVTEIFLYFQRDSSPNLCHN